MGDVAAVSRALTILDSIEAAGGQCRVSELAVALGMAPSTVHRLIRTLEGSGYLRQLPDRRYALGARLAVIGQRAVDTFGGSARPVLRTLAQRSGESANLAVRTGRKAEYVAQVPGTHSMRMFTEVGRRVPLYCTGVGKVILASLTPAVLENIAHREGMPAITPSTITNSSAMRVELERIRTSGYAVDEGEMEIGVRCIAVLVPTDPPMAVSVSGPPNRLHDDRIQEIVVLLREAAATIAHSFTA
jgi:IclR family acetate operon transcriptional repressor